MNEFRARVEKIEHLKKLCSGILLYNADAWSNPNYFWLSRVAINGWLWVPFNGHAKIFVSKMYRTESRSAWAKVEFAKKFEDILDALPRARIGIDALHVPGTAFGKIKNSFKIRDISEDLELARSVKTDYEIRQIKKACSLAKSVFGTIRLPYRGSEAKLRADLEWEISQRALEPSFPTIVASGANIATPHHVPSAHSASKPLLVDMGVRYNGYCSDTTRTYGSKYQSVIDNVFKAVEPMLKPGAKASAIYDASYKALGKYGKNFITGLGHGIGIAVHEDPSLKPLSEDILQAGNVLTVEPGIYVNGGIRHENMYLITKRGAENLTDF